MNVDFVKPLQSKSLLSQSGANPSIHMMSPSYLLVVLLLILPTLVSQFRILYRLIQNQLPVGSLTPDAQFAIGFANHILYARNISSFNVDGITTPFYTGVFTTLATFNNLSPMDYKYDLIVFSWLSTIALSLALFRLGKSIFPESGSLLILFATLYPFSLSAWPITKNRNDVGAQSIGIPELIPSATLAIFLFISCLVKLLQLREFHKIKRDQVSPLEAAFRIAPLGIHVLAISCLKPSIGYVVLTFFFIYGLLTTKVLGQNILSYSCLLLTVSLLVSNRYIFPSTEGLSINLISNLRLLSSPFSLIVFISILFTLSLRIHLDKQNLIIVALQINAVIWSAFVVNVQFTAEGRNTIYGLIPILVSATIPVLILGIISIISSNPNGANVFSYLLYIFFFTGLAYWVFEYSPLNQLWLDSPEKRRLILLLLFLSLVLFVFISIFLQVGRKFWNLHVLLYSCAIAIMVLGASNFKNTLTIWDFRSDEVKLRQEFIPAYVKREVELKTIADILRSRNIGKYATNSWCRYLPNGIRDFKFGFYDCDNRAFEVSSIVVGTPLLGGWSYDYKYGRDDANDNFIETLIDVHKVLWEIKDVSKFWGELGVSALILERGMPMPEVDITNLTQFKGHYFTLYING